MPNPEIEALESKIFMLGSLIDDAEEVIEKNRPLLEAAQEEHARLTATP